MSSEQLEFALESHAPRFNAKDQVINEQPKIKVEEPLGDDYFNMSAVTSSVCTSEFYHGELYMSPSTSRGATSSYISTTTSHGATSTNTSRPNTLDIDQKRPAVFQLGLDCMMDGHTGLTPLTGAPSSQHHTPCNTLSPTTLLSL